MLYHPLRSSEKLLVNVFGVRTAVNDISHVSILFEGENTAMYKKVVVSC